MINVYYYERLNDVDITYLDFIQHITPFINIVAPFKEMRIQNLIVKFKITLFSEIHGLKNLKPLELILMHI